MVCNLSQASVLLDQSMRSLPDSATISLGNYSELPSLPSISNHSRLSPLLADDLVSHSTSKTKVIIKLCQLLYRGISLYLERPCFLSLLSGGDFHPPDQSKSPPVFEFPSHTGSSKEVFSFLYTHHLPHY